MIDVVGGTYYEKCIHPNWEELLGSGGRATSILLNLGVSTTFHSYMDNNAINYFNLWPFNNFIFHPYEIDQCVEFHYINGLSKPEINNIDQAQSTNSINIKSENILSFGFIENQSKIDGTNVVYDPQNVKNPILFSETGSSAKNLAIILNKTELYKFTGKQRTIKEASKILLEKEKANVVIVKLGPKGALVTDRNCQEYVPAYKSKNVWPIGSGDCFTACFTKYWLIDKLDPITSANYASKATAYYCKTKSLIIPKKIKEFDLLPIEEDSDSVKNLSIYLAGPFFTLSQKWLIEETRNNLISMGYDVFSPYHDVGLGTADQVVSKDLEGIDKSDVIYGILDGLDPGTIFEIGYAVSKKKKVIIYCENESEENLKMIDGTNCNIFNDYVSSLYNIKW